MKALSFTQPWLVAVLHHMKRVENRQFWRGCSYRGPILLHAAKGVGTQNDFDETWDWILDAVKPVDPMLMSAGVAVRRTGGRTRAANETWWAPDPSLPRGAIVGRARVDGVIASKADFASYSSNVIDGAAQKLWWMGGFALVLADVEAIDKPVTQTGALGLFEVPEDALAGRTFKAVAPPT